jgi:isopentenyl diphosphate isomerase/L-lactate dehydrogenase-like FMN-dependent dehydrogenase
VADAANLLNVWDYERLAEERLDEGAFGYFAGGAGDEHAVRGNVEAFGRWRLRPRVLVDVGSATTATTVLGEKISMPILTAPVAFQRMAHPDGEVAVARAAAAVGTIMCLSSLATSSPAEIAENGGGRRWFQLYWHPDRGITREMLERARAAGFSAVLLTVDVPVLGPRERDLRTGFTIHADYRMEVYASALGDLGVVTPRVISTLVDPTLSWRDLEWLHEQAEDLPVLVKGVLSAEDAVLAVEHGCAGVVVSNHGGRQLDRAVASLDALPEVVEAVGDRAEVLLDGGIRRGTDVAIALALGARAVLVGRPTVWGLAVDGAAGVQRVLELLRDELLLALALLGSPSPGAVGRDRVVPAPRG